MHMSNSYLYNKFPIFFFQSVIRGSYMTSVDAYSAVFILVLLVNILNQIIKSSTTASCNRHVPPQNIRETSTTPSCSGPLRTHNIKRDLVPGVVYSSSSSQQLQRGQIQFQIFLEKDFCLEKLFSFAKKAIFVFAF